MSSWMAVARRVLAGPGRKGAQVGLPVGTLAAGWDEARAAHNEHHLVWDLIWYGITIGMAINFLQVYVVRLGAPELLVSAVVYGPAIVGVLWQLPAAQLMGRTGKRMYWVLRTSLVHRAGFLVIALLPFVFMQGRAELTVLVVILQAIPLAPAQTSFLAMLADAVPPDRITRMISGRMIGFGIASTLSTLAAGLVLRSLAFPLNYQVLFVLGFLAAMVSQWHMLQLRVPDREPVVGRTVSWRAEVGRLVRYGRFALFTGIVALLHLGLGMVGPLVSLFWVRSLGLQDWQISAIVTLFSGTLALGSYLLRRVVSRVGRHRVLAVGIIGYALYPLLSSLAGSFWALLPFAALGGLFYSSMLVTLFDSLIGITPDEDRTSFVALYSTVLNIGLVLGPILGGVLAGSVVGTVNGLRITALVILCAGLLFTHRFWRGLGAPANEAAES